MRHIQGIFAFTSLLCLGCGQAPTPPTTSAATSAQAPPAQNDGKGGGFDPLNPIQRARAAANTTIAMNNLKQIALAFHIHHDAAAAFPGNIKSKTGQPLLSWRVAILPYVEAQSLYEQFKQDEPWDSPHNKKLLDQMPKIYIDPRLQDPNAKPTVTHYRGFAGAGGVAGADRPLTLGTITNFNGAANTFLVVEAAEAVPWTRPDDLVHDLQKPLPKFADAGGFFLAAFCDGHVQRIPSTTPERILRCMIQYDNQEIFKLP